MYPVLRQYRIYGHQLESDSDSLDDDDDDADDDDAYTADL